MKTLSNFTPVAAMPPNNLQPWRRFATVTVTETRGWWRWRRETRYTAGVVQRVHGAAPWRFTETDEPCPADAVERLIRDYLAKCPPGSFFDALES